MVRWTELSCSKHFPFADKLTGRLSDRRMKKQIDRWTEGLTCLSQNIQHPQIDKQTDRHTDRWCGQSNRWTDGRRDKNTGERTDKCIKWALLID